MKVTDGGSEAFIEDLGATPDEVKVPGTEQEELPDQAGGEELPEAVPAELARQ
jgi:hypothetical protein